jgi:hypothetical protein
MGLLALAATGLARGYGGDRVILISLAVLSTATAVRAFGGGTVGLHQCALSMPGEEHRSAVDRTRISETGNASTFNAHSIYLSKRVVIRLEYRGICCFKNPLISLPASRLLHRQRVGLVVSDVGLCKRRRG